VRPMSVIAGSLSAFLLTALLYCLAKFYGWQLSGFEWIATFIAGWAVGIVIDWARVVIFGKRAI